MSDIVLLSSDDALTAIGHNLTPITLHRWTHHGAVTPTQPAAGPGTRVGWTPREVMMLEQVAHVRADLEQIGLPCPWRLVRKLWADLDRWGEAELHTDTVTISIRLGSEDT